MSSPALAHQRPDRVLLDSLQKAGLLEDPAEAIFTVLTGGVASEIWKVETGEQSYCIKRALPKLKVEADWFAPVERNRFEVAWCKIVEKNVPGSAPHVFYHDEENMLCCMEFLDPADYSLWKDELRDGRGEPSQAEKVGQNLGRIHSISSQDKAIQDQFPRTDIFHAIRLEPYLEATASKHPDLKEVLFALSKRTGETRPVMIHGDTSPKNIMIGPNGPVFIDAECACMGDPAFDLAFCLKHFLLKCLWVPAEREKFLKCFEAMVVAYLAEVSWEDPDAVESRTASLLPGLFLGRVDGKSPVEYVTEENEKNKVRRCATGLLVSPPSRLMGVVEHWKKELIR
jgi:5-methylthioribose kinase